MDADSVLNFVRARGPVIPREVVKEQGGDTFLVGAVLSTLTNSGKLKISHAKLGGTPLYYADGQEEKLQRLYDYLHEKEKKAFDLLKKEKVLHDYSLPPVLRVALRNIKDFARPIEVNLKNEKVLFWKWYLVPTSEAGALIKSMVSDVVSSEQEKQSAPLPPEDTEKRVEQPVAAAITQKEIAAALPDTQKPQERPPVQRSIAKPAEKKQETSDKFLEKILRVFASKDVEVLEHVVVKKNSEIDMVVLVPSPVGRIRFYCKAKDKKKINDKDLGSAMVQGHSKRLPVIFATNGDLSKKLSEMLQKEFSGMTIYRF